jgi:F420-dependent oxidoreductase-like protein
MGKKVIGVAAMGTSSGQVLDTIRDLETRGIQAAWLTTAGAGLDALTLFAAAAVQTERIKLGTSIVPTWPRHPMVAVQQVQVLAQLADGRFRLGVGPSHKPAMESAYGFDFRGPLTNLREYLTVVKSLLHHGQVEFDGRHYHAHASILSPWPDVPIMASALRASSFELCGELADGAISWVCPGDYLRDVGLPAMRRGAQKAGRLTPPLVAHVPMCVHDDSQEALAAVQEQFGRYAQIPFYARMFEAAGFPEASSGRWSDAMIEAVAIMGSENQVAKRLDAMFDWGAGEILVSVVPAGPDKEASRERTLRFLAELAKGE